MTDIQETVATVADELVGSGAERGLQVAAYVGQQPVVDVAAGVADPGTGRPVRPGTLFYNWSIGKGATATLVHRLVDAGQLAYDTPVAEVWPEFAATDPATTRPPRGPREAADPRRITKHGKQAITVRQVLNHSAGVPGLPPDVTLESVCSWPAMVAALEDAEPWWEPGTKVGYHAYTFGHLAGEIVRRVTGRALGDVLGDLTAAIGLPGEIRYGIGPDETVDLAVLEDAPSEGDWTAELPDDLPMLRAAPRALLPTAAFGNDPRVVAADIPAGAKVTARALARMYAGWLGPVDGRDRLRAPAGGSDRGVVVGARPDLRQRQPVGPGLRARAAVGRARLGARVRHGRRGGQLGGRGPGPRRGRRRHAQRDEHGLRDRRARRADGPRRGRPRLSRRRRSTAGRAHRRGVGQTVQGVHRHRPVCPGARSTARAPVAAAQPPMPASFPRP
jgi:hypothetical protein